jgi:hypothetical protein
MIVSCSPIGGKPVAKVTELLYALAGARDDDALEAAGEITAEAWPEAISALHHHGLAPILSYTLRERGADSVVPTEALWQLRSAEEGARLWRAIQEREASQVIETLASAGIPHLLMKGLALSRTAYAAPHLRVMSDSDILIPVEKSERAVELVMGMGYNILEAWHPYHHIPELYKPNRHPFELHLQALYIPAPAPLYRPLKIGFDVMAGRGVKIPFGSSEALVPCPNDLFLQQGCNFVADFEIPKGHPLRWVRDFAELILHAKPALDWATLPEYIREIDPELVEYMALVLALCEPFLSHLYSEPIQAFRAGLPARYEPFVSALSPVKLIEGWGTSPGDVFRLLTLLMGRGRAMTWALSKVFISRDHVIRQTQRSPKSFAMRFYPSAFCVHLKHHLVDGGGTPPRMPPPVR